jgi:hypothetical protein
MAPVIEFLRILRDESGAAVAFVHHTGHTGSHMRGSSDLESVWETRLTWSRDGQAHVVKLKAEHREAEPSNPIEYRINWDCATQSMRFDLAQPREGARPLADRIIDHLREHSPATTDQIRKAVNVRRSDVQRTLEQLEQAGTTHRAPSGRRDGLGRPIHDKAWHFSNQAGFWPVPDDGADQDDPPAEHYGPSRRPASLEAGGTDQPPDRADTELAGVRRLVREAHAAGMDTQSIATEYGLSIDVVDRSLVAA